MICQTAKVALNGFEDFNIELIALVQNPLTRAPFAPELAGRRTRPLQGCGNGPPAPRLFFS